MPESTVLPLNVVTPSGTKTRTFAPSDASLAELRKILVEDAIIKPHVRFHVDDIIIGATAEVHMKWTEVIREIHVCEDASLVPRDAPCIPVDSRDSQRSAAYPSPTQTPSPDDNKGLEQPPELFDYPFIPDVQPSPKTCDDCSDGGKEPEDCTDSTSITPKPCLSPALPDCPDTPCDGYSSNPCGQPSDYAQGCFTGGEDPVECGSPATSEPCLPCDPPEECDSKCLDQPCSTKDQDCAKPMTCGKDESSSLIPICRDQQDTDRQEPEECLNGGCLDDATSSSKGNDDCCSEDDDDCPPKGDDDCCPKGDDDRCSSEEDQEDSPSCVDRSASESKQAGFKYRPLRLSSDTTLFNGEFNFGKPRTPRTGGFGRVPDQRTPSRPTSAVRSNFNFSLSSSQSNETLRSEDQHPQDRTYNSEQPRETDDTSGHFEYPAREQAPAGTIGTPGFEGRSVQEDFPQRLRSGTIRETKAPSVAFGASVNVGNVAQVDLSLSSRGSKFNAIPSAVSIDSRVDAACKQRLDIVNTVKTVMQAGCADSDRFAAAFGGLRIDASLFQGATLSTEEQRGTSCETVQSICETREYLNEDTPTAEGNAGGDVPDRCTSPSASNTSIGLNTGFTLLDDEERSMSGNCTGSTRFSITSITSVDSVAPPLAKVPLYRLYSPTLPDHFYTTNAAERDACTAYGYILESTAAQILASPSPEGCSVPFFRIYRNKEHFYTTDVIEKERVVGWAGTRDEGIAGYVYAERCVGTVPLYRLYNPGSDDHFYTTSAPERETCVQSGQWNDEGVACYVYP